MTRLLLALVVATIAFLAPTPAGGATASRSVVSLDGVTVHLREGTRQVVTVNHTAGYRARVTFWALTRDGWEQRMQAADGRIGYGGLVVGHRRHQNTGTTPIGTYGLPSAFGTHARDAAWDLPYRQVRRGDFWVQDNQSPYYNRYRNQRQGGFRWWLPSSNPNSSERLTDYRSQYEWSIVMGFNTGQVRHRGAGIFLHVNGSGPTAGCVSAPRWLIAALMKRLDPGHRPVIAIGR